MGGRCRSASDHDRGNDPDRDSDIGSCIDSDIVFRSCSSASMGARDGDSDGGSDHGSKTI